MSFTDNLHKTLKRQIRNNLGENFEIPSDWQNFIKAISDVYTHLDEDRILSERAMDLSSRELMNINKEATDEAAILQATLNATTDGILIIDDNGNVINYNNKFLELWKFPETILAARNVYKWAEFVKDQFIDPDNYLKTTMDNYTHKDSDTFDILKFKDGRIYERYTQPLKIRGQYFGRVLSFRNVTIQKQNEVQMKKHNDELEKMNNLMIDREMKMIELKKRIKDLESQAIKV